MTAAIVILGLIAFASFPARRALNRWLDKLDADIESDEVWRLPR